MGILKSMLYNTVSELRSFGARNLNVCCLYLVLE